MIVLSVCSILHNDITSYTVMAANKPPFIKLDLTFDVLNYKDEAIKLLNIIRPEWQDADVNIKVRLR